MGRQRKTLTWKFIRKKSLKFILCRKWGTDPARLLAQATSRLPVETRPEIGKSESVRRTLRRQRRAALPEEPKCTSDFILDEPWTTTGGSDPQQFLMHDSVKESTDRVLVFPSLRGLETLAQATDWFGDGTFSVCPRRCTGKAHQEKCPSRELLPISLSDG